MWLVKRATTGSYLLEQARAAGLTLIRARVEAVDVQGGNIKAVQLTGRMGSRRVATPVFVNAAGPHFKAVGELMGLDLPVHCEAHFKLSFDDVAGAMDRHAPLIIWADPTALRWSDEERDALRSDPAGEALLRTFPAGVHGRPDGTGRSVLLYWPYHCESGPPQFPMEPDPAYPEIVMRGMAAMVPALHAYFERIPKLFVDGGYYTKTVENRPLIGPLPVAGAFAMGAFSGFGIMTALGAGELLAAHVLGQELPAYAPRFCLSRYTDPAYCRLLEDWPDSGQL